jgi:hypothetical protein
MLRHSLLALALITLGCGSSDPEAAPVDAAPEVAEDTGKLDTGRLDTGTMTDTALPGCESELPSSFMCTAPTKSVGKATCTDAALLDMLEKCIKADITVPTACADWKTANAACASCVGDWSWDAIAGKIYPDDYKCYWSTFDAPCAKTVNCLFTCQDDVCVECADEERTDCYQNSEKSGGKCWDVAGKDAEGCFTKFDAPLEGCNVNEIYKDAPNLTTLKEQILKFYRGACRDNADWSKATMPAGGDAGTDTGTDAATTETSVSDAADAD